MPDDVAVSSGKGLRTAVLLCQHLASLGRGLNLDELRSSLETSLPSTAVEVVADLCRYPAQLSAIAARCDATRVVLGLCSGEYPQVELQTQAREIGLDPFGLEVLPLGTLCARVHPRPQATEKARGLLTAAIARARAFQGSEPEHAKLYFLPREQKVTRRSLFAVPPIAYRPVPGIQHERCTAEVGCQLCSKACPRDALQKTGGRLLLDKARCEGCGVCLAACPRGAISFPGWSLSQFEAQLSALLGSATPGRESTGLLFTCQRVFSKLEEIARQDASYCHQWLPVVVPCLGMITPTWILQSLAHGAAVTAILFCGTDCPFGQKQAIGGRVNFCRRLLRLLGQAPERVRTFSVSYPERLLQALQEPPSTEGGCQNRAGERLSLGTLEATLQAIRCLAPADGSSSREVLEHPYSPFGMVELQAEACTGCLACIEVCPTGALAAEHNGDTVTITYAASSCTGCGICTDACPEAAAQVLQVRRVTDLQALSADKVVLHENRVATCVSCGASIASQALLRRIEASLGGGNETLRIALGRYCPSCRLSFAWGGQPSSRQQKEV